MLDSLLERVKERAIAAKEKAVEAKTRFVVGQARTERHTVRMFESKRSVKKEEKGFFSPRRREKASQSQV